VTIGDALRAAADCLRAAGLENGASEAVALWGLVSPSAYLDRAEDANADNLEKFWAMVERRARREPFSHISGRRQFYKSVFCVTPDVLDPRPETEILVELALQAPFSRVLDLGAGSGCILISLLLEMPSATGVGTDISEKAILVAGQNAEELGVAARLILPLSDWYADIGGRFDLIVSNPPYISTEEMADLQPEVCDHEPRIALTDEADGLTAYRRIAAGALDHLTPGGRLMVEIGPTQGEVVRKLFIEAGLENPVIHPDLDGRSRVVSAVAPNV
jgi:release factor glutamine methyltransferase